ncbi:hypothetical protein TNCV_4021091 [Trichonephila clavipes]|nr:hypothetical protein TNCV_4021091 [Trichonephila clavipes]
MTPAKNGRGMLLLLLRQESISGESPVSFPEDTSMPFSGFEPEPTRLQAECHNHHTRVINVALSSSITAIGNGPRNFEPRSSDEDNT